MSSTPDAHVSQSSAYDYVISPSIRILVGPSPHHTPFSAHSALLISRSGFFAKALSGEWKEGVDREVQLPEDEEEVFRAYLVWLYTGKIAIAATYAGEEEEGTLKEDSHFHLFSRLYVLAEKLIDETAKTAALDALNARAAEINYARMPNVETVCVLYNGTPDTSPARQWLANLFTTHAEPVALAYNNPFPSDFLADLALSMASKRVKPDVFKKVERDLAQALVELELVKKDLGRVRDELTSERIKRVSSWGD